MLADIFARQIGVCHVCEIGRVRTGMIFPGTNEHTSELPTPMRPPKSPESRCEDDMQPLIEMGPNAFSSTSRGNVQRDIHTRTIQEGNQSSRAGNVYIFQKGRLQIADGICGASGRGLNCQALISHGEISEKTPSTWTHSARECRLIFISLTRKFEKTEEA